MINKEKFENNKINGDGSMKKSLFETLKESIMQTEMEEKDREKLLNNLLKMKNKKINLMITGATGVGKSSTINALFDTEVAKVGTSVEPETMDIEKYELDNLIIWDTPGLGDGKEADNIHSRNIINKLYEKDEKGDLLIDLVLVLLDGGSRDLGTSYELINNVIIPNLGENKENRILVAINQADMAIKGKYWNYEENRPEKKLKEFLIEKVDSVKRRIKDATGVDVEPIYYSAGYKEEGEEQIKPYNLSKLLYYILQYTPTEKRIIYAENRNKNEEMWKDNDELMDYRKGILESLVEAITSGIAIGSTIGGALGNLAGVYTGVAGKVVGGVIGGVAGAGAVIIKSVVNGIGDFFGWW